MKKRTARIPGYRLHKPSGLAVVTLSGKDFYLGPYGSAASRALHDKLTGEWLANGRRLQEETVEDVGPTLTVVIHAYWTHAQTYYRKNGKPTSQVHLIKDAIKPLRRLYGETAAKDFRPLALKAVRQQFIDQKLCRNTVNAHIARIKRLFRWASEEEMVPPATYHSLLSVKGLAKDRTEAPDRAPVAPATLEHVQAILPRLRPPIRAMVELQCLTGMRPGEVLVMRGRDIDRSGPVWKYVPESHKTEHHDRQRTILLGPKAQAILEPWLTVGSEEYLFRPRPMPKTLFNGRPRTSKWTPGPCYSANSYRFRIRYACGRAKVPVFAPNQLRHLAATRIRAEFGLEAAQVILGHARADVTQVYAERDLVRAADVMSQIG
jgi:integrase